MLLELRPAEMAINPTYGRKFFLVYFLLVVLHAQGQVLERDYLEYPLDEPTPLAEKILLRNAAAISREIDAQHLGKELSKELSKSYGSASHRREAQELASLNGEVEALTSFRDGISGGDTAAVFKSWDANDSTPCGWTGVACSLDNQHVVALNLSNFQLVGRISSALPALSKLQFLRKLDLSDNNFTSVLPGAVLVNFSNLAVLDLSFNQITGEIPHQIGKLLSLQWLALEDNALSSEVPSAIGNCTLLKVLNLRTNFLRGEIPQEIGRLAHLEALLLGTYIAAIVQELPPLTTDLTGSIPAALGNCSSLSLLDLRVNPRLGGRIPPELSQLKSLEIFALTACNFKDAFPRWIGNLSALVELRFGSNHFYGTIPREIGSLRNLSWLTINRNNMSGDLPAELGNCTSLISIFTTYNAFTGVLPSGLGNCTSLQNMFMGENGLMDPEPLPSWVSSLTQLNYLSISTMNLFGKIPEEFGRLTGLYWLVLTSNDLHGSIPSSLSNCTSLIQLSLEGNNLTGQIPSELGFLGDLSDLAVGFNHLSGPIPRSLTNLTLLALLSITSNSLSGRMDEFPWVLLPDVVYIWCESNLLAGPIPSTLGNCSNLAGIGMDNNRLTGAVPRSFGNLTQLGHLSAPNNSLTGRLPGDLARCYQLQDVDLRENELEGSIPPEFGQLSSLEYLDLSVNKLNGTIPVSLMSLSALNYLNLSHNQLSGNVPGRGISRLQSLTTIDVSENILSGSLAYEWRTLVGIQAINVSANSISGSIASLANLSSLESLDVSRNNFSGEIPESLASFPRLAFLNASYNNFEGPVPASEAFVSNNITVTADSFLGNPELCGAILGPSQECPPASSTSRPSGSCDFLHCPRKWIPVTAAGALCIFLAAVAVVWLAVKQSRKAAAQEKEIFDTFLNFRPNVMKFAPADIFAVIREDDVIGRGARSVVYRGSLPGCDTVAIKTFVRHHSDGVNLINSAPDGWERMLEKEASIQGKLRHRNVLKVLSFYSNLDFQALVLEYMPQGSLQDHLYSSNVRKSGQLIQNNGGSDERVSGNVSKFPWSSRFGIAMDIAEGMTYLHHDCPETLIHGDLKPSNLLLDEQMVAKVSDFGISKVVNSQRDGEPAEATVSRIHGTVGYMPPEYAFASTVSTKGDVFGYGVLVLELLTGRPPTSAGLPVGAVYRDWNLERFQRNPTARSTEFLDPILREEASSDALIYRQMLLLARVSFFATRGNPESRPSMKDIRSMLLQIKDLGEEAVVRRSVNELAHQESENVWENEDLNAEALPSISGDF